MARARKFKPDAAYQRGRAFVLAFAAFVDALPRVPTTIVGEEQPDGTVSYREISTPRIDWAQELAAGLTRLKRGSAS